LGRNFFPLLGKPFAIGTSVSVQPENLCRTGDGDEKGGRTIFRFAAASFRAKVKTPDPFILFILPYPSLSFLALSKRAIRTGWLS
jgi:hypothetical protein